MFGNQSPVHGMGGIGTTVLECLECLGELSKMGLVGTCHGLLCDESGMERFGSVEDHWDV